jgi:hypothetical protein
MPVTVTCPACRSILQVPEQFAGRWITCPTCRAGFAAMPDEDWPGLPLAHSPLDPPEPPGPPEPGVAQPPAVVQPPSVVPATTEVVGGRAERCYDCGQLIPEGDVCRMNVMTGSAGGVMTSFDWGTGHQRYGLIAMGQRGRASLCPDCYENRQIQDAHETAKQKNINMVLLAIGAVLLFGFCLIGLVSSIGGSGR